MNKLPISVCIISGAEAQRIGRALESVAGWVSEIVVVLNEEVQDGTAEIVSRHGGVIHRRKWQGFREQKNLVQSLATQPWILQLDADEEVSTELRAEISGFFQGDQEKFAGASFPRKMWFLGRWITHGDWYPDRVLRLYRGDAGCWGGSAEHCAVELRGAEKRLRADLLHYSSPTMADYLRKFPYYSELYLQRQLESGARWSALPTIVRAAWRFVRAYIFRCGFLDGYPGFFIAASTAYGTLYRHTRLYEHMQPTAPPCPPRDSR
ncbi:MAG: glycosyl transferase [Pedosphaera sp.]|nr:glycosyl transferase [Pedosphaera sp.]